MYYMYYDIFMYYFRYERPSVEWYFMVLKFSFICPDVFTQFYRGRYMCVVEEYKYETHV